MIIKNGKVLDFNLNEFVKKDIRIEGDKIVDVGVDLSSESEDIYDAENFYITPGLIDAHSHILISEEGMGEIGDDCCDYSKTLTPELEVIDAIYPFDKASDLAIRAGVTTVMICPGSDAVVGGVASIVQLGGKIADEMIIKRKAAMKCSLGENPKSAKHGFQSRMGSAYNLRKCLEEAKEYEYNKNESLKNDKHFKTDLGMENMLRVLKREMPIHVHAHRSDDICTAIRIAREYDIDLVIVHGTDAVSIVDYLKKFDYPIILGPTMNPKSKQECWSKTFETAGILGKNNIKFAITADHDVTPIYHLIEYARISVKYGLPEIDALKALTLYPAEILGIEDIKGDTSKGKDADLAIWSDHPFSLDARVKKVFIKGKAQF